MKFVASPPPSCHVTPQPLSIHRSFSLTISTLDQITTSTKSQPHDHIRVLHLRQTLQLYILTWIRPYKCAPVIKLYLSAFARSIICQPRICQQKQHIRHRKASLWPYTLVEKLILEIVNVRHAELVALLQHRLLQSPLSRVLDQFQVCPSLWFGHGESPATTLGFILVCLPQNSCVQCIESDGVWRRQDQQCLLHPAIRQVPTSAPSFLLRNWSTINWLNVIEVFWRRLLLSMLEVHLVFAMLQSSTQGQCLHRGLRHA